MSTTDNARSSGLSEFLFDTLANSAPRSLPRAYPPQELVQRVVEALASVDPAPYQGPHSDAGDEGEFRQAQAYAAIAACDHWRRERES